MIADILAYVGLAIVAIGAGLVFLPAGLIVAGLGLIAIGVARAKATALEAQRETARASGR